MAISAPRFFLGVEDDMVWLVGWLMEFGSGTNLGMYGYVGCFVVGPPPHLAALLGPCLARRREKINHFNWRAKHTSPFK